MKKRVLHIVLGLCAVVAATVLFVTYGTVLPAAPFAPIQLNGPSVVDSDGEFTVVVDTESHRALILNADGDMTGVISCTTADSPVNVITDACVSNGVVYLSGARLKPDSDIIEQERVVAYDKGGNLRDIVGEMPGEGNVSPSIKSVSDSPQGIVVGFEKWTALVFGEGAGEDANGEDADGKAQTSGSAQTGSEVVFATLGADGASELSSFKASEEATYATAFAAGDKNHCVTLSVRGVLGEGGSNLDPQVYAGRMFTAVDVDSGGSLYACDDETGSVYVISPGSEKARELVSGTFHNVRENKGVIGLCNTKTNKVTLCDVSGKVSCEFSEVKPSIGFSARMVLVWASGLYLVVLAVVLAVRKVRRQIREGKTEGVGPMLLAIAVVSAIAVAVGSFSFASYQKLFDLRSSEINMCADYLMSTASNLSNAMEKLDDRHKLRGSDEDVLEGVLNLYEASMPEYFLVNAANSNDIGMYFSIYSRDGEGIFYLVGSSDEYVMGTSARVADGGKLEHAFEKDDDSTHGLLQGRTLRDATLYRLVQIPSSDGERVVGVIEIGSKMRSFEASIMGDLAQRILGLLVMVLVVYLAYSELRACGRCLFSYRQRLQKDATEAIALLTRPFTLVITMLMSVDSVMTVLIALDLLNASGMDSSGPLVAIPAVMLGIGLVLGQGLYGIFGSRVGLRRLMAGGAFAMLLCACLTGAAVAFGDFWLYCAAKLALSAPFGLLYVLGYSLPRIAASDETRAEAAGGVKRTDTSAAALGMVLGGYAVQVLGNAWVYVLVAVVCLPVILMALNLLPRKTRPLEVIAQPEHLKGRIRDLVKTPAVLALAVFIVLPVMVAAGYASFLFPLFSVDLGLSKLDINNIVVLGQLVVYVCIGQIERVEARFKGWRVCMASVALLGVVFLLFSVNTTLAWSFAVVALVALLVKAATSWRTLWLFIANEVGVPAGRATGAMFVTRSLALVAQPFILGALLGASDSFAVIVISSLCIVCALLFFLATRNTVLAGK